MNIFNIFNSYLTQSKDFKEKTIYIKETICIPESFINKKNINILYKSAKKTKSKMNFFFI